MIQTSRKKTPPTENEIELAKKLKYLRNKYNLSLEKVADYVGVSKVTISRYENLDITNIPSDKIEKLAKILHTTPAYLMGWEKETDENKYIEEVDISMLSAEQKQKLDIILSSNLAMFFNGSKDIDEEEENLIRKSIIEVFIHHLKKTKQL